MRGREGEGEGEGEGVEGGKDKAYQHLLQML